jgi:Tfp pilus assembly protein PilN
MRPLRLNFESEHRTAWRWLAGRPGAVAGTAGVLALVLALGGFAALLWELAHVRQDMAAAESELRALGRRAAPVSPPVLNAQQRNAWKTLVAQLNTPWATLLGGLEAVTSEDVALVSIEPDARQRSVRLQAEAKTLDALLAYAQALKATEPFADVVPVKHETNEQDPNRPVRLAFNLRLRADDRVNARPEADAR